MPSPEPACIRVITPGWCTTIQDLGRHGYQHYGLSVSGAMDRLALVIANRLVRNRDAAAALEITLLGPELLFEQDAVLAITGADLSPAIDGVAVPLWTTVPIHAGSHLRFGPRRLGARSYLAVAGGFDVPLSWASRSTHLASGMGGLHGRALVVDDLLHVDTGRRERPAVGATLAHGRRPPYVEEPTLRVLAGPQEISGDALSILTTAHYHVSNQSDRMGYRLEGQRLPDVPMGPYLSDGTAMGALQIPPDGSPILLMADRPTTGGYPKLAAVISADLPQAAQLQPGDRLCFRTTTLLEAETALASQWRRINEALPPYPKMM
ncbi:MAG TPA: biotin-dependent carboxyltransferase family protein [Nitrospira sp.]|nr:biotin-dependent carboxyltransferase family protein [Nitrospira sp.]